MIDPSQLGEMMRNAQEMQQKMQDELRARTVEGQAGGGMVKVTMNGLYEVSSVKIEPAVINKDDASLLEDLVRAAIHAAVARVEEARMEQARGMAGQLGIPQGMF
jgi:hypothetical protein